MLRTVPTFLVPADDQRELLDTFQRRCLHFSEAYSKNNALCFTAKTYQRAHPDKIKRGSEDADATLASPMVLGICDGVSQVCDLGLDASEFPRELLRKCEDIAATQLTSADGSDEDSGADEYAGPIGLLKDAYSDTESKGSTTVLLAVMDNSTQIHGKLHPMIGVVTLGDCELLILRRTSGRHNPLQVVLHTEKQRIGGSAQAPLQLARLSESVAGEAAICEDDALEAIERGSGLHCMSAYEGDLLILGSDGVFDNLFLDEVVDICNEQLPPLEKGEPFLAAETDVLGYIAKCIVDTALAKSQLESGRPLSMTPLGLGGKIDDTSVVVAEVSQWTAVRRDSWLRSQQTKRSCMTCFSCSQRQADYANDSDSSENEDAGQCCIL